MSHVKSDLIFILLMAVLVGNFSNDLLAQQGSYEYHRQFHFREKTAPFNKVGNFTIEVGKPKFISDNNVIKADFLYSMYAPIDRSTPAGWMQLMYADTVTLTSYVTSIEFHFSYQFMRLYRILKPDSSLKITYLIYDVDSHQVIAKPLICEDAPFQLLLLDSLELWEHGDTLYDTLHYVIGKRVHTFQSNPGQRVITMMKVNWSALRDDVEYEYAASSLEIHRVDTTEYEGHLLPQHITKGLTAIQKREAKRQSFWIGQNYPNPFNATTRIQYFLPERAPVTIKIYDLQGRLIKSLKSKFENPGQHAALWDGTNEKGQAVSSGIYIYQLNYGGKTISKKLILIR